MAAKIETPELDNLLKKLAEKKDKGEISDEAFLSILNLMDIAVEEMKIKITEIFAKGTNQAMWIGFGMGIAASLVIAGVVLAIVYEMF